MPHECDGDEFVMSQSNSPQPSSSPREALMVLLPANCNAADQHSTSPNTLPEFICGHKVGLLPSTSVEGDDGESLPVEMDQFDNETQTSSETNSTTADTSLNAVHRWISITNRVCKMKTVEQRLASLMSAGEARKREVARLLTEHAQIVNEVAIMEYERQQIEQRV